ncbi:hypothetical protein [Allobranchiibius sp. CTAmp26]|uniref:hypothetical protein n=1 Tax=Allobranchiibius sp. CTAmp26 TaxID=2815214 RepID=UPI001AA0C05C|nr:hypothetical protein [Allobranchiibius sp. CTAmp26]MBO1756515.1 hypothetical protein [Allobranchiibius sp. CTAmp26]
MLKGAVLIVTLLLAGCSSGGGAAGPSSVGKYEQTWTKGYSSTTCDEFINEMDPHQRFVAAADMLGGARQADGGTGLPGDSLVNSFKSGLDQACEPIGTMTLTDAGAALYLTDRSSFRP